MKLEMNKNWEVNRNGRRMERKHISDRWASQYLGSRGKRLDGDSKL